MYAIGYFVYKEIRPRCLGCQSAKPRPIAVAEVGFSAALPLGPHPPDDASIAWPGPPWADSAGAALIIHVIPPLRVTQIPGERDRRSMQVNVQPHTDYRCAQLKNYADASLAAPAPASNRYADQFWHAACSASVASYRNTTLCASRSARSTRRQRTINARGEASCVIAMAVKA